jgi:HD superfamily phosphodiesterase
MGMGEYCYSSAVESRFPGLIEAVRNIIGASESKFQGYSHSSDSYLWEHTTHVASFAYRLAIAEDLDPLIPTVVALFHDAGKFAGGRYHADEAAEEEESARIAAPILRQSGMKSAEAKRVLAGLKALYSEKSAKNVAADIVHDADFLSKFGSLGVANFFVKAALRGRTIQSALLQNLSKELTYAACLPLNMRTATGLELAGRKSTQSLRFFRSLLAEMREAQIADLKVRRLRVPHPDHRNRMLEVRLVAFPACTECGGRWQVTWTTDRGVKCRRLNVVWICRSCGDGMETSFCLPEIYAR